MPALALANSIVVSTKTEEAVAIAAGSLFMEDAATDLELEDDTTTLDVEA